MRRVPWTRQPPYPVGIDRTNPLSRGLVNVWTPFSVANNIGTGSLTRQPTRAGIAIINGALVTPFSVGQPTRVFPMTILRYGSTLEPTHTGIGAEVGSYDGGTAGFVFTNSQPSGSVNNNFSIFPEPGDAWSYREFSVNATNRSAVPSIQVGVIKAYNDIDVYWEGKKDNGTLVSFSVLNPPPVFKSLTPFASSPEGANFFGRSSVAGSSMLLTLGWNRALIEREVKSISANPWQVFEPYTVFGLSPTYVTAQYARPTSDASAGTWTASSGSDLYAMLDETTANDADYITTVSASTCEVALGSITDPAVSTGHIVRYRLSADAGGITVRLRQGTTTIATWTHAPAPASLTLYEQTLSSGEANSITDYTALRLQFEATE